MPDESGAGHDAKEVYRLAMVRMKDDTRAQLQQIVTEIGTKYMLWVAAHWNEHFKLTEKSKLQRILDEAVNFDFRATV
jgi:hypothetical protein